MCCLQDTPGYGDNLNLNTSIGNVLRYIQAQVCGPALTCSSTVAVQVRSPALACSSTAAQ